MGEPTGSRPTPWSDPIVAEVRPDRGLRGGRRHDTAKDLTPRRALSHPAWRRSSPTLCRLSRAIGVTS
jgi:hypothetical protein